MDPRFEVLPPGPPPAQAKSGVRGIGAALLILAVKFKTVATMLLSIWAYSFLWGWPFAIGFVLLIFIHEMGHVIAAKLLGIPVTAPLFIPFVGAAITLRENPRDAWTEALMAYGGPLAGALGGFVVAAIASVEGLPWLMAVAQASFVLNLFNLIPLPPLDGGRVCAAVSPLFWILGLLLLGLSLFFFRGEFSIVIAVLVLIYALPRLKQTFLLRKSPEMQRYYGTHPLKRLAMAAMYVSLIVALLLGLAYSTQMLHPVYSEGYQPT